MNPRFRPFPHDCYDETEHLAKAERRRVPDERRPLRLVKSKRNYINRLYARKSEHEMRIRESFINEMAMKSPQHCIQKPARGRLLFSVIM